MVYCRCEKQSTRAALNSNAKVMKLTKILHREFLLQSGDGAQKESRAGSREHNIVHVEE